MIRVLIVDDSAFMRIAMRKMIESYTDIEVIGEAKNGAVGLRMAIDLKPDVITMDVEMPEMDGITATREIMAAAPCPIIMVSSLTEEGTVTTMKALEMGAVDFIPKKSSFVQLDIVQIGEELASKIRIWAKHKKKIAIFGGVRQPSVIPQSLVSKNSPGGKVGLVVVGISTGGPAAMPKVLSSMGKINCPMIIAQHMPALFTKGFADHMRIETGLNVVEGVDGMSLEPGMVVIAPGGTDSVVREPFPGKLMLFLKLNEAANIHPNADVLFRSAFSVTVGVVAVVMTGMGCDGTEGARMLKKRNVPILVQSPESCVVDGMTGSVIAAGMASDVLSLEDLGRRLAKWCA